MIRTAAGPRYGGAKPCWGQGRIAGPGGRFRDRLAKDRFMSNPPVQPSPPNGSEPGEESTQAYGQNAPQTPPAYGQNAPQTPQYGQQTPPAYGQNAPQTPQYGQQSPPAYGQNA